MTGEGPDQQPSASMRAVGTTAAGLAAVAAFGQAFVVLREVYTAAETGTSANLDALVVALVAPSIAVGLLSSSTQAALVPAVIEAQAARGREAGRALAGTVLAAVTGIAVLMAILLAVFTDATIALSGPGLSPTSRDLAASFVPVLLPLVVLAPAGTLLGAVCQVQGMFGALSLSWVAGPMVALAVTVRLWDQVGVRALAIATTADAAATVAVLIAALLLRRQLPRLRRGVPTEDLVAFWRHAAPLAAGSFVLQLNLLADRAVASFLAAGSISALRYGERIVRAPISVLMPAWSTVIYPAIARTVIDRDQAAMGRTAAEALRFVIASFLPLSVATAALAPTVVALAFERGAFGRDATLETAKVLAALGPLILLWLVHPILNGAHNARRRGSLLAWNAVLNAVLNVVLNVALGLPFGIAGIALSTSITGWLLTSYLALRLRALEPDFDLVSVVRVSMRAMIASLVPAIPLAFVSWVVRPQLDTLGQALLLVAGTVLGAAAYLTVARIVHLREPWIVIGAIRRMATSRLGLAS